MEDMFQGIDTESFFLEAEQQEQEFTTLHTELGQLFDTSIAIETYGINPTALAIMQSTGLLDGTSLNAIAVESISIDKPEGHDSQMALEGLMDNIKQKAAQWSAKILQITKDGSAKLINLITPLMNKVTGVIKSLTEKAWDKTKAAGRVVKAHPYKTAAAVVAAIAAVAGIAAFCASRMSGAYSNESMLKSFLFTLKERITGIEYPQAEFKVMLNAEELARQPKLSVLYTKNVMMRTGSDGSLAQLDWTPAAVKNLGRSLESAWSQLRIGLSSFGQSLIKMTAGLGQSAATKVTELKAAAPKIASGTSFASKGVIFGSCIGIVYVIWKLIRTVVIDGIKLIGSALRALNPF